MGCGQGLGDRSEDVEQMLRRHPAALTHVIGQGLPRTVLHEIKRLAAVEMTEVLNVDNCRMADGAYGLRLAEEALDQLRSADKLGEQDLARCTPFELGVLRQVHDPEPTLAKLANQPILKHDGPAVLGAHAASITNSDMPATECRHSQFHI